MWKPRPIISATQRKIAKCVRGLEGQAVAPGAELRTVESSFGGELNVSLVLGPSPGLGPATAGY